MEIKLHWAERFLNWYPRNTRLYFRKKRGQEPHFQRDGRELFDQLAPFLDELRDEALREGRKQGLEEAAAYVHQRRDGVWEDDSDEMRSKVGDYLDEIGDDIRAMAEEPQS